MKIQKLIYLLVIFSGNLYCQDANTLSNSQKIYGLSKFWTEANYNFADFSHVPTLNWDSAYNEFIPRVLETKTDYDYYNLLIKFAALLKESHTRVWFPKNYYSKMSSTMFGDYQFYIENIENKAIIVRINSSKINEIPIGSEIIEVNGKPIDKYIEDELIPYTHASTDHIRRDWAVSAMLWGFYGQKFDIKLKTPAGDNKLLSLVIKQNEEKDLTPPVETKDLLNFKWLRGNIAFLALNSFYNPRIDTLFLDKLSELRNAKGLIIDLRDNGGGYGVIGHYIAKYFLEDSVFYESHTKTRKNIADFRGMGRNYSAADTSKEHSIAEAYACYHNQLWEDRGTTPFNNELPASEKILIPTVILIGHGTASAAESFLMCFTKSKNVLRMGENTNGSTGNKYLFDLPGGAFGSVCTSLITYPDGKPFTGIIPDIEIKRTVKDFINNYDRCVDEAVRYLINKLRIN